MITVSRFNCQYGYPYSLYSFRISNILVSTTKSKQSVFREHSNSTPAMEEKPGCNLYSSFSCPPFVHTPISEVLTPYGNL